MTDHFIRTVADLEQQATDLQRKLVDIKNEIRQVHALRRVAYAFVDLFDTPEKVTDAMVLPVLYGKDSFAPLADIIAVSRDTMDKRMIYSFNINGFKSHVDANRLAAAVAELANLHL